jgi:hypothetical protein
LEDGDLPPAPKDRKKSAKELQGNVPPARKEQNRNSKRRQENEIVDVDLDDEAPPQRKSSKGARSSKGAPITLFAPKKQGKLNPTQKFAQKYGYCWDLCIVYKILDANEHANNYQKRYSLMRIAEAMHQAGMQTSLFYSNQQDEIYCKIRAPVERIRTEADRIDLKMMIHEGRLKEKCKAGITEAEADGEDPKRYMKGEVVKIKFKTDDIVYWPGKVARVNNDGTYDITYDIIPKDGTKKQTHVEPGMFEGHYRIEPFELDDPEKKGCLQTHVEGAELYPYQHIYVPYDKIPRLEHLYYLYDLGGGHSCMFRYSV